MGRRRSFRRMGGVAAAAVVLGLLAVPSAFAGGPNYTLEDIAPDPYFPFTDTNPLFAPGDTFGYGYGINSSGWVSGTMGVDQTVRRGFLWKGSSQLTDLGTLSHGSGIAGGSGINSSGAITGTATARSNSHGFKWVNGSMSDIGTIANKGFSLGNAINVGSVIVGSASISTGPQHAIKYDGSIHDLGVPPGGYTQSRAYGINSAGLIVGFAWSGSPNPMFDRAFIFNGSYTLIQTLGGTSSIAHDINDSGTVVGVSTTLSGQWHAFSYSNGLATDITPGAFSSEAFDINNNGDIVGEADGQAFLYSGGQYYNLQSMIDPTLGWTLISAVAINDSGQIVVLGSVGGVHRVARLTLTTDGLNALLLSKFEPEYRFSSSEPYRPTSAQLAVDMVNNTTPQYHENVLRSGPLGLSGSVIAHADPTAATPTEPKMTLDNLGSFDSAVIDEDNDFSPFEPSQIARQDYTSMLQSHPGVYNDQVYGRVVLNGSDYYLQYWVYYYFNQKTVDGIGEHEGDWEMVTIRLNSFQTPVSVTFAQHQGGERCAWGELGTAVDSHVVAWVANGSHASYFVSGRHPIRKDNFIIGWDETATNPGYQADTPAINDVTTPPAWITWNGWWGNSDGGDIGIDKSPQSPGRQGSWDPVAFENGAQVCGSEGDGT